MRPGCGAAAVRDEVGGEIKPLIHGVSLSVSPPHPGQGPLSVPHPTANPSQSLLELGPLSVPPHVMDGGPLVFPEQGPSLGVPHPTAAPSQRLSVHGPPPHVRETPSVSPGLGPPPPGPSVSPGEAETPLSS